MKDKTMSKNTEILFKKALKATQKSAPKRKVHGASVKSIDEADAPEREFWAIQMDETKYLNNLDKIKKEIGIKTIPKLYAVYITDMARVHIASLTPSAELELVYHQFDYRGQSERIQEKLGELSDLFTQEAEHTSYYDHSDIERMLKTKNARSIGTFESYDDAREAAQSNYPF